MLKRGRPPPQRYVPHTDATRRAYDELLEALRAALPPGGDDIEDAELFAVAERAIAIVRFGDGTDSHKRRQLAPMLGYAAAAELPPRAYTDIVVPAKQLHDFVEAGAADAENADGGDAAGSGPSRPGPPVDASDLLRVAGEDGDADLEDEEEESDEDDSEGVAGTGQRLDGTHAFRGASDDDDEHDDDEVSFIDINVVRAADDFLVEQLKHLLPTLSPNEWPALASRIAHHLADPNERSDFVESHMASLLKAGGNAELVAWIEAVVKHRWSVTYGLELAKAARAGADRAVQEAAVIARIRAHALTDRTVALALERLTGESVTLRSQVIAGAAAATTGAASSAAAPPLDLVDLDGVRFASEASVLSSVRTVLPRGTPRPIPFETHTEIVVPPPRRHTEERRRTPLSSFPQWAQRAFPDGVTSLNAMQSVVEDAAFRTDQNLLICAPTGAGKTNVAMMALLRVLSNHRNERNERGLGFDLDELKMVYIAPMKALVQEVVRTFGERLAPLGINVAELSGDAGLSKEQLQDTQLIVTTPEKWDIVTRKAIELGVASLLKLIIIDEVHLLHNERGPVLEAIVARTNLQILRTGQAVRLVGLSATLPNYRDVAAFLRVAPENTFFFDKTYRPVPLQLSFCIYKMRPSGDTRVAALNRACYLKVMQQATRGEQTLVFVHSRKDTEFTARYLLEEAKREGKAGEIVRSNSDLQAALLGAAADSALRSALQELLPHGFATHHAGMSKHERSTVEQLFLDRKVRVLVCTSTLAWGVNLPAHAVVIKGTQVYAPNKGGWMSLSSLDVFQMFGRAGRPGYDDSGEAAIITSAEEAPFFLKMLNHQMNIESQLMSRVVDMLNAEIQLGTVTSIDEAAQWLEFTYFYVRLRQQPQLYGAQRKTLDPLHRQYRRNVVHTAARVLAAEKMIHYDESALSLSGTPLGRIASHFYLTHKSVATYSKGLQKFMLTWELIRLFCKSEEFAQISVRRTEERDIHELKESCPVPINDPPSSALAKVSVLLQAHISRRTLQGTTLASESVYIRDSAERILRAMYEIALVRDFGETARKALELYLMVSRRQWGVETPLRQFLALDGVPPTAGDVVREVEGRSAQLQWEQYYWMNREEFLEVMRGSEENALLLERLVRAVPRIELSVSCKPLMPSALHFAVELLPRFDYMEEYHGRLLSFALTVETLDGTVLQHDTISLGPAELRTSDEGEPPQGASVGFVVRALHPLPPHYYVRLVSTSWLGCSTEVPVRMWDRVLPEPEPAPASCPLEDGEVAVADLAQMPGTERTTADGPDAPISWCAAIAGMAKKVFPFDAFFRIPAHTLPALVESENNVFVSMPPGCGKTTCAELFVLSFVARRQAAIARLAAAAEQSEGEERRSRSPGSDISASGAVGEELRGEGEGENDATRHAAEAEAAAAADAVAATAKLICVLPTRQQAERRSAEWSASIEEATGIPIVLLDGCVQSDLQAIAEGVIIIATPATLAAAMRRATFQAWRAVTHVIFDHLHRLRSAEGLQYELAVMRLLQLCDDPRVLGLSYSTVCAADMAEWIGVDSADPGCFFPFNASARRLGVRLQITDVPGFRSRLQQATKDALHHLDTPRYLRARTVVFVPTTADAQRVAAECYTGHRLPQALDMEQVRRAERPHSAPPVAADDQAAHERRREQLAELFEDEDLAVWASVGVGCLHVGTSSADLMQLRDIVASMAEPFVLVCAVDAAARLPAAAFDFAIVCLAEKPSVDALGGFTDCPLAQMWLLVSRAHRDALVFCRSPKRFLWEHLLNGSLFVESEVLQPEDLLDAVNVQVVERRVRSERDVMRWLKGSFYFQRIRANPNYYGLASATKPVLQEWLSELIERLVGALMESGCIHRREDSGQLEALPRGIAAAHHGMPAEAVAPLIGVSVPRPEAVFAALASVEGISAQVELRRGEERLLARALRDAVPEAWRPDVGDAELATAEGKVLALLLCHCAAHNWRASSHPSASDLLNDLSALLPGAVAVVSAAVDFLAAALPWPVLRAMMAVCPMLLHGAHPDSSPLAQCSPIVTPALEERIFGALPASHPAHEAAAGGGRSTTLQRHLARGGSAATDAARRAIAADLSSVLDAEVEESDERVHLAVESIAAGCASVPRVAHVSCSGRVDVDTVSGDVTFEVAINAALGTQGDAPEAVSATPPPTTIELPRFPALRPRPVNWWVVCYNGHDEVQDDARRVYGVRRVPAPEDGQLRTTLRFAVDASDATSQDPRVALCCDSFFVIADDCPIEIVAGEEEEDEEETVAEERRGEELEAGVEANEDEPPTV